MDAELVDFIETSFGSVWALELMLILRRVPERGWTLSELVSDSRSSEAIVKKSIDRLVASGLAMADETGAVRFRPASEDLGRLAAALDVEYRRAPAAVRRIIVQTSLDKLRTFSDAFRVKRGQ